MNHRTENRNHGFCVEFSMRNAAEQLFPTEHTDFHRNLARNPQMSVKFIHMNDYTWDISGNCHENLVRRGTKV